MTPIFTPYLRKYCPLVCSVATSSQSFTERIGAVEYHPCCHQNTTNACGVDVECFCAVLWWDQLRVSDRCPNLAAKITADRLAGFPGNYASSDNTSLR